MNQAQLTEALNDQSVTDLTFEIVLGYGQLGGEHHTKSVSFVALRDYDNTGSEWTVENIDGAVTTGNNSSYSLVNTDGQSANRAIAGNTAWHTDKVRTDENGNKQYRVSTDEWINASSVSYTAKNGTATPGSGLINVITYRGTIRLAADQNGKLFTLEGKPAGRSLLADTVWRYDKRAQDSEGNYYFRVSTNEWLKFTPEMWV